MASSYYFYDLETSGIDAKWHRIMQFAGQRTDLDFNPIGEPDNIMVRLTDEVLPEPEAIMVTGITPQATLADGITEAEFLKYLVSKVATAQTTMMGYNTIRFDDEFIRYALYRNYYDPYEREWSSGRSRWDLVDMARMTRALRPDGIEWSFGPEGRASNRLELLAKANGVVHESAHDALSDVLATIGLAKLFKTKQPKLFKHLESVRNKKTLAKLLSVKDPQPLVHSTGRIAADFLMTSVVYPLAPHPTNSNAILVYDLRYTPGQWLGLSSDKLAELAFMSSPQRKKQGAARLPVKAIHLNKSPALAPLGVLDEASQTRIGLTIKQVEANLKELLAGKDFGERIFTAWQNQSLPEIDDVDGQLYQGFIGEGDKRLSQQVLGLEANKLGDFAPKFSDERLNELWLRYRARNFPKTLSANEQVAWDQFRAKRLSSSKHGPSLKTYFSRLQKLAEKSTNPQSKFLLEELKLYGESIVPFENQTLL